LGCADCQNGQVVDPYDQHSGRYGYTDYDDYSGVSIAGYAAASGAADFTEADGEMLVKPQDEFEDDMSAS